MLRNRDGPLVAKVSKPLGAAHHGARKLPSVTMVGSIPHPYFIFRPLFDPYSPVKLRFNTEQ